MASDIDIASNALILIGDNPISSFTEPGAGAQAAANLYEETYKQVLSEHPWTFALKEQKLNRLSASPDPLTNWKYAFQNPTDLIRYWAIFPWSNYNQVGDLIYSNQDELLARYVYKVAESQLPAHFVKTLEYKLASDFALLVTEDDGKSALFEQKYRQTLAFARATDSQGHPQQPIISQPFTDVRRQGDTFFGTT
jgi:hypothetical protein